MRSARKPALDIRVSVTFVGLAAIATPVAKTAAEKIGLVLAAGLDGIENRMVLSAPVNKNLFDPSMAEGLGLETLPTSLEEAVQAAEESEFLRRVLPEQLASRYFTEELKRCEALKHASDPVEYERTHYFNAI